MIEMQPGKEMPQGARKDARKSFADLGVCGGVIMKDFLKVK